ncbi:MAG: dockerin type I repeat-containing protein [Candidatus Zixiibacteriota bacterium]
MMRTLVLRWGVIVTAIALAMPLTVLGARHTVTSLPYAATVSYDTLDLAGTKVVGNGSGIKITGNHVVVNLGSDTLQFGNATGTDFYGILVSSTSNVTVIGGHILRMTSTGSRIDGIKVFNSNSLLFKGTNIAVTGHDAHCVNVEGGLSGTYNVEFNGGRWISNSESYSSREAYSGAVFVSGSMPATAGSFDLKLFGVRIMNGPGQGIILRGKSFVQACTLSVDAYNKYWDTVYTWNQAPIGASWANPYCILARGIEAGSEISGNYMLSGSQRYGSRGVLFEISQGTTANPIRVFNNVIDVHEGPNKESGNAAGNCQGFRIRGVEDSNIFIYNNSITCTVDDNATSKAYGKECRVFYHSMGGPATQNIIVQGNVIRAVSLGGATNPYALIAEGDNTGLNNQFIYNRIESSGEIVKLGGLQGACRNVFLLSDTLGFLANAVTDKATFSIGYYKDSSINNIARDCVYLNGARDTNIVWTNSSGDNELSLERTMTITALGNNGLPVPNATVTVRNAYGKTVLSGVTGSRGQVVGGIPYWYESEDKADSLVYNPVAIKIKIGVDSVQTSLSLSQTSSAGSQLTLTKTAGQAVTGNSPPTAPTHLSPENGSILYSSPIRVTISNSTDANNDPVTYDFWISGNETFTQVLDSAVRIPAGLGQTQALFTRLAPETGKQYWWRCRASDGIDYTGTTNPTSFSYNCNNSANVTDVTYLAAYLFRKGPAFYPVSLGDMNGDGRINVIDLVYLTNYLFMNGPAPKRCK